MPTNQDRIVAFDYLRVIAVLMVMACHWMQFHKVTPVFGSSLGAIANCFFFAMSGLALGLGWRRHGCVGFGKSFVFRRLKRLYPAFLVVSACICGCTALFFGGVSIKQTVLNLLALSWFAEIPLGGHLWFVTGLTMLYFLLFFVSRASIAKTARPIMLWLLVPVCVVAQVFLTFLGIGQSYVLMLLLAGVLSFVFAEKICDSLLKARGNFKACLLSVTVLCGSEILLLVCRSASTLWLYYWIALCSAAALFVLGFSVFGSARLVAPFGFLAGISYELYLVHYPVAGHLPLMIYFPLTIVSAFGLGQLVKAVFKLMERRHVELSKFASHDRP